ncbi:MAG: pitrilysin family protein [Myxococcota bacterium]
MSRDIIPSLVLFGLASAVPAQADDTLPPVPASEKWRDQRPQLGPANPPQLPTFEKTVLPNGLTIYVATERALPLVSYRLVVKGGSTQDPDGQGGLTNLTYGMLQEGTQDLDVLAFSDRVADLGASFGGQAGRDQGSLEISGLRRHADVMLGLLADALLRPRMAEADFERLKGKTLANLSRQRASPQGLAFEYIPQMIYGADHPYGHPVNGTIETIAKLTLAEVKAQYRRLFAPRHTALIAVGDVDLNAVRSAAQKLLGDWSATGEDLRPIPAVDAKPRRRMLVVNKPRTPQTFTLMGRPMFARGHPDETRVWLANSVFGGTFGSRLNMNLREGKGYTYGANSVVSFRTGTGALIAYAALRQDATAPGLAEMFSELKGLNTRPPNPEEVADAKTGRIRSLTGQFQSLGASTGAASALFVYDLPLDYFSQLPGKYDAVSLDHVQAAARKYFQPDVMAVLMIGDAPAILPALKKAGLGPIEVVEPPNPRPQGR